MSPSSALAESFEDTVKAVVSGRVQGVGYRYFVIDAARHLSLSGTVCNLRNGTVKVLARGPRAELEELLQLLHEGPPASRVDDVQVEWGAHVPPGDGFHITRG